MTRGPPGTSSYPNPRTDFLIKPPVDRRPRVGVRQLARAHPGHHPGPHAAREAGWQPVGVESPLEFPFSSSATRAWRSSGNSLLFITAHLRHATEIAVRSFEIGESVPGAGRSPAKKQELPTSSAAIENELVMVRILGVSSCSPRGRNSSGIFLPAPFPFALAPRLAPDT